MKVAIVGCGNQGVGIGAQLLTEHDVRSVLMLDYSPEAASRAAAQLGTRPHAEGRFTCGTVDAFDLGAVCSSIRGVDLLINATMPELNLKLMSACIHVGAHYLDLYAHPADASYAEKSATLDAQISLNDQFREADLIAVPSVGINPGWVNLGASAAMEGLDVVDKITIRELEWLDSDELLISGPAAMFVELFLGGPGVLRMRNGKVELIDLVRSEDMYDFPQPVGKQGVLSTNGNGTALLIAAESPVPIGCIEEKFAVLSGGLSMKDILLTAISKQTAKHSSADNMFELFGDSFIPTSSVDLADWHSKGLLRNAAWISSVEVSGRIGEHRLCKTIDCIATIDAAHKIMPWAPPGVVVTSAMPAELALRIGRGEITERGVLPVTKLGCSRALLKDVQRRGVEITEKVVVTNY